MAELVELIGPQARRFIAFERFKINEVVRLGNGLYGVEYQFSQRLTRPFSALACPPPPSVMSILRSVFPSGRAGEVSTGSGFIKLKETDEGWQLVDRGP